MMPTETYVRVRVCLLKHHYASPVLELLCYRYQTGAECGLSKTKLKVPVLSEKHAARTHVFPVLRFHQYVVLRHCPA